MTQTFLFTHFGFGGCDWSKGYFVILQSLTNRNETAIQPAKSGGRAGKLKDY